MESTWGYHHKLDVINIQFFPTWGIVCGREFMDREDVCYQKQVKQWWSIRWLKLWRLLVWVYFYYWQLYVLSYKGWWIDIDGVVTKEIAQGIIWQSWNWLYRRKVDSGLGFWNIHCFNLALLGKLGWKLMAELHSLVARILKARYFPSGDFLNAHLGHKPSFVR
jgi:hypothetical protein